ncbi:MAG: hypothetical protein OXF24_02680, partial [Hyphomicrobiales bacterium]|nr:hypothetical protein [Hyphomicrobiales bacterium]
GGLLPLTITITDDEITEGKEIFHHLFHEPRGSSGGLLDAERWRSDADANEFTLVILSSDNSVGFAQPASGDIPEAGGSTLITLAIAHPIDPGETVTVDLGFAGGTEGTDFEIVSGTATYDSTTKKLTLPTEASEATFTLEAVNNSADGDSDKDIELTLSNPARAPIDGWGGLGTQTTHTVKIKSSIKNFIGFTKDAVAVAETVDTDATVMLQLSKPDGMPFTDPVPAGLSLAYSSPGNEDNDFSIQIDGAQAGSSTSAAGTVQIAEKAHANGLIPVTITVANDSKDEGVEEFVYTIAAPASPQLPMEWVVDGTNDSFTLVILASDSNVEFAESSSEDISENGGSARITINISNPIPDGETVTVALAVTDRDGAEGTGFTIVDGTAKYAAGKLTLPTGVTEADFTLQAQDNNTRGAEKNLTLTLSDLSGAPDGWAPDESNKLGDQTTHSVTIVDDDKNTIGFTKTSFSVGEDAGELSTVLLLSNGDGTPYTDSVPTDLSLRYTLAGTNRNDFSNEIEFAAAGTGASLGATGTLTIPHGHSIDKGEIPVTITITEDEIPENMEEFVYTIEASPSRFPEQDWRVDPGANRLTLVITDNDNSISIPGHNTIYNPRILEESAENLLIPVTLNAYAAQNITFNVAVRAEDHTTQRFPAGNDVEYTSTIEFLASDADNDASAPGHQQTENIVIEPVRDGMPENREEFYVTLRPVSPLPAGFVFPRPFNAPLNSPVIGYSTSAFAIPAHDNTITFDFNQPTTVAEGETITLNVRPLDNELPLDATFRVTSDAEDPSDITITPNPVTLPEGLAGNKSFTVTANQDADAVSEFITLRLVPNREFPAGWGITNEIYAIHRITIEDDETATVLFDPANRTKLREAEGEVSLRVNFENGVAPAGGVGLSLTSSDPALVRVPGEASSFTIEEGHDGFAFTVDVLADGNAVKDTVTLTLRKGTDGNGAGFPDDWSFKGDAGRLTLELEIGDRGTVGFAEPSDNFAEPSTTFAEPDSVADKQKALLQISPDHRPTRAFTLAFHLTSNGAVNDRNTGDFFVDTLYTVMPDKVSSFGTIEYPVLILPDDEYERDESFTLTLAENQPDLSEDEWYIDPDKASYTVTIPINDIPSGNTLGFTAPTMTVKERTGEVQIEVVSSAPAPSEGLPLQVALAKSAGSRTVFTGAPTATTYNITIGPGESSTSFPVSIFDDASEWADEEVTFTLSLQNNFPSAWGTGTESGTITTSTLVLTIDDRDDGVIGIVDPRPVFREPYPGEPTYQSGYKHAIDHYFEVSISEIPRRGFNLGFASAVPRPNVKPYVLIYEINFRTQWWVTPEDAADGKILVPFGIARDGDLESTEYYGVRMVGNSLPGPGWRIGQHPRFDYSLLDSNGGQIWFPPNDTQVGNVLCNPSFIREAQSPRARMCLMADSHGADSPVRVNVVGSADAAHDDDFRFSDEIRIVRGNTTLLHFPFGLPEDNKREEDRTYTLIAEEAPGFPGHGRRIDPARNLYTFTVPANGGSIDFHPSNSTTLTEGEGMRQLSLELEGGATPTNGINLSLVSSNPAIVDIPATYRNFTIPASSLFNYSFSVDVKTDSNTTDDIVTLTLRKGADLPGGWEFKGGAAELTMDFAVIDASSTPSNGTIQFSNSGFTEFEPETNPVSGINNRKRGRIPLRVSPPPLVAFDLPIEVSGSASFGIADQTCTTGCLDGTYDVTRDWRGDFQGSPNALLPLESSGADTVFARIKPSAGNTTNLDFLINDDTHFEGTETFILTIPEDALLPDGFTLGEHKRFVLTISANDNAVQFSSGESSVTEGGLHNTVAINFTTPLPPGTSASIVMRSALNGGASANDYFVSGVTGGSYNAGTNTFTALAGTDSLTFNFSANDDTIADPGESVTFTLDANASSFPENWGGIGSQTSHTVTIRDDEVTSIGFAGGTVEEPDSEGDTAILLVNASANIGNDPAEFEWTVSPAEYVTNPTGKAALTSRNYVLEIMAKDDNIAELAKEVTVTLTDGDTNDIWTIDEGSATRTFTIPASDNTVTFAAPSPAIISENGGVATITAAINRPALSGGAPVVAITPSGSANSGDYSFSVAAGNGSLSGNTWTLPTGTDSATLTVTTADNNNDDSGNKTLTLGFADAPSMPTGWNVSGTASRTITITDD